MSNRMIRFDARKILKGQWLKVSVLLMMFIMIVGVITLAGSSKSAALYNVLSSDVDFTHYVANGDKESIFSTLAMMVEYYMTVGVCTMLISVVKGQKYSGMTLFQDIRTGARGILLGCVVSLFTILWTLLFIIPGIMKAFSYSMSFYVLAQNPDMPIMECIKESERMMKGNRLELLWLRLVFVGYKFLLVICALIPTVFIVGVQEAIGGLNKVFDSSNIVALLLICVTLVVGSVFIMTYEKVSEAIFYMFVSGQEYDRQDIVE